MKKLRYVTSEVVNQMRIFYIFLLDNTTTNEPISKDYLYYQWKLFEKRSDLDKYVYEELVHVFYKYLFQPKSSSFHDIWLKINDLENHSECIESKKTHRNDEACSICQEEMNHTACTLMCGHQFHKDCIYTWVNRSKTCPICRTDIKMKRKE